MAPLTKVLIPPSRLVNSEPQTRPDITFPALALVPSPSEPSRLSVVHCKCGVVGGVEHVYMSPGLEDEFAEVGKARHKGLAVKVWPSARPRVWRDSLHKQRSSVELGPFPLPQRLASLSYSHPLDPLFEGWGGGECSKARIAAGRLSRVQWLGVGPADWPRETVW